VMSARLKGVLSDGSGATFSDRETEFAFRTGGGFDVYLTPGVVLNLDAAYLGADDTLDDFSFATLGGGLEFRF